MSRAKINEINSGSKTPRINSENYIDCGEEFSIKELWDILVKGKFIIATSLATAIVIAFLYVATTVPIYSVNARLKVGLEQVVVSDSILSRYVERPEDIVSLYNNMQGVSVSYNLSDRGRGIGGYDVFVNLSKSGSNPEELVNSVKNVLHEIIDAHKKRLESSSLDAENFINVVKLHKMSVKAQIEEVRKILKKVSSENKIKVVTEERNLQIRLIDLERMHMLYKTWLNDTTPSRILMQPYLPDSPLKPRKVRIISIAILMGLVAGLLVVFIRHFLYPETPEGS